MQTWHSVYLAGRLAGILSLACLDEGAAGVEEHRRDLEQPITGSLLRALRQVCRRRRLAGEGRGGGRVTVARGTRGMRRIVAAGAS
eukprot:scaffold7976_cov403-Prasinococcus_capsulatus_cf.AAC.5